MLLHIDYSQNENIDFKYQFAILKPRTQAIATTSMMRIHMHLVAQVLDACLSAFSKCLTPLSTCPTVYSIL